jgi:predicted phage-related endonuclease
MKQFESVFIESNLKPGSTEWLANRKNFIGASELGSIMGLSPYLCSAELFHRKLGLMPDNGIENNFVYWGHSLESVIATAWEAYNGEADCRKVIILQKKCRS